MSEEKIVAGADGFDDVDVEERLAEQYCDSPRSGRPNGFNGCWALGQAAFGQELGTVNGQRRAGEQKKRSKVERGKA